MLTSTRCYFARLKKPFSPVAHSCVLPGQRAMLLLRHEPRSHQLWAAGTVTSCFTGLFAGRFKLESPLLFQLAKLRG